MTWLRNADEIPCLAKKLFCRSDRFRNDVCTGSMAGEFHQVDFATLSRLKPQGRPSGDVEPETVGLLALESQKAVDFEKMRMGTDLYRPITEIVDPDSCCFARK